MADVARSPFGPDARLPTRRSLGERLFVRWSGAYAALVRALSLLPPRSRLRRTLLARATLSGWGGWARTDLDLMLTRYAPDCHLEPPRGLVAAGMRSSYDGHAGFRELAADWRGAWEPIDLSPQEIVDAGNPVVVLCHVHTRARGNGIEFDSPVGMVYWHKRGMIVRECGFDKWDEALRVAGIPTAAVGNGRRATPAAAGPFGLRAALKRVPGLVPLVYGLHHSRRELNALAHGVAGFVGDLLAGARQRERFRRQAVFVHPVRTSAVAGREQLVRSLEARGVKHRSSPGSIYIPPQPGLAPVLGDVSLYPDDTAFKVMLGGDGGRRALLAANLLHLRGLAPRVYDRFELSDGEHRRSVFAIQDRGGLRPSPGRAQALIASISALVEAGELAVTDRAWSEPEHVFADRAGGGPAYYVGFENLRVRDPRGLVRSVLNDQARRDLHFGTEYALKGNRYLYQSVPAAHAVGRRNTRRRWNVICSMLADAGISLESRVTLDIGCNAGMIMGATLADDAAWSLGWDLPHVAHHARPLMLSLGYTRFDVFGAELDRDYDLAADIPASLRDKLEGAVVFYLAFRHNVGYFLSALGDLPWAAMVYEGGEEESVETLPGTLEELGELSDFSIASAMDFRDSETRSRPIALLVR